MKPEIYKKIESIFKEQKKNSQIDFIEENKNLHSNTDLNQILESETKNDEVATQIRVKNEFNGFGPISELIEDTEVTEILINSYKDIYYEKNGKLQIQIDHFFSEETYSAFIERLSQKCQTYMNRDKPFIETQLNHLRITIIFSELSRGHTLISIRKQPIAAWTLQKLQENNWCNSLQGNLIKKIITDKKNFLVVGGTGSGKTSFLQAILESLDSLERNVLIEDTQELHPPNLASVSLLTRQDPSRNVSDVTMDDLLKRALRLRPDRIVVGEIRGSEAKSLLMMMATGHDGSFGSLHARTAHEALLRLEMLVQMGAPQWTLQSIRKLMAMTIQNIFVVEKENGVRKLKGIYEVTSLEENGLILQKLDEPDLF